MYDYVLFPGRHHLFTRFQLEYLAELTSGSATTVVVAITSADHRNTRRNPVPYGRREAQAERAFAAEKIPALIYPITDIPVTNRFADHTIKAIETDSAGAVRMTPANTIVACSTPSVIAMYRELGYAIAPMELGPPQWIAVRPWDIVSAVASAGSGWRADPTFRSATHPASVDLWLRYSLGDRVVDLHSDPLVGDEGDLTDTRDYAEYIAAFDAGADRKYRLLAPFIRPGRIVDIGCATGAVIAEMGRDARLAESDLYGIEVARRLFEVCQHRREQGYFVNPNTFFHQRNIARARLFPDSSVDTTTTLSLTHEILSYVSPDALRELVRRVFDHTASGGVYLNYDVCGPDDPDRTVHMRLRADDGTHRDDGRELDPADRESTADFLSGLSTSARFARFASDFRAKEGDGISYRMAGDRVVELTMRDAMEFLSTKDYTDSWYSEMHERFCALTFADWRDLLTGVGFELLPGSGSFVNEWLVEHRFAPCAQLSDPVTGERVPFGETNVVLAAHKS